jgi:hypothetical protein
MNETRPSLGGRFASMLTVILECFADFVSVGCDGLPGRSHLLLSQRMERSRSRRPMLVL